MNLCSQCKTGKYTYELDKNSTLCPYILCNNGKTCSMFEKLDEPDKKQEKTE